MSQHASNHDPYVSQRNEMVQTQLLSRGVLDTLVLKAMRHVPRHAFLPKNLWKYAYEDGPLPIGFEQTISQPYMVAYMTEKLVLHPNDRVLEIGSGSGYQAAVLAEIVDSVFTMEIVPELGMRAQEILSQLNVQNIQVRIGDGYSGWPEKAPFDAMIITAAPPSIPGPLIEQLKPGGRMILPVGVTSQQLILITKNKQGGIEKKTLLPVRFVPMTGEINKLKPPVDTK